MNNVLLQTKNLSKIYTDDRKSIVKAVNDITLQIYQGETFGLVGESGCGKTLCASFSMGLGPQTASLEQGKILVNGQDMTQADDTAWNTIRGKDVSMIFQEPMTSLNPLMKVGR